MTYNEQGLAKVGQTSTKAQNKVQIPNYIPMFNKALLPRFRQANVVCRFYFSANLVISNFYSNFAKHCQD